MLLGLGLAWGSACGEARRADQSRVSFSGPRADVFLRASGGATLDVELSLGALRLRSESGEHYELPLERGTVSSSGAARRLGLAGGPVPAGRYEVLVVELTGATVRRTGVVRPLRLLAAEGPPAPGEEVDPAETESAGPDEATGVGLAESYDVPLRLEIGARDAVSVFLEWNVEASLVGDDGLRPAFGVSQQRSAGRIGLLYVTDAATGTLLSVDRSSGEVVGSVAAGAEPRALAVGELGVRAFTANAGDGSVSVLDARTGWTRYTLPIQLTARTGDVAVVERGRTIAAVNPALDTVSVFDVPTLTRSFDVRVGRRPVRLVVGGPSRRIFVVEELSDRLGVVDVMARSVVASLPVGTSPSVVAVDRREREVIVGHRASPDLLFFDIETLAPTASIAVGGNVTALLADVSRDRVYVARGRPAELAIVDRRLGVVTRRIRLSGRVENLAQPFDGPFVYGAAPDLGALLVINVVRGREENPLPCGTAPSDVAVAD